MRPRLYAGENLPMLEIASLTLARFNEAPALCRGKHVLSDFLRGQYGSFNEAPALCRGKRVLSRLLVGPNIASMRPRLYAGENDADSH